MKAGDRVECIDDSRVRPVLQVGRCYTAVSVYGPYVDVGVMPPGLVAPGFLASRFRLRPTDISVFTAALRSVAVPEHA